MRVLWIECLEDHGMISWNVSGNVERIGEEQNGKRKGSGVKANTKVMRVR